MGIPFSPERRNRGFEPFLFENFLAFLSSGSSSSSEALIFSEFSNLFTMDKEKPSSSGRKVKFTPKAPQRRAARPAERKSEIADEDAEAQRLLRRFNESLQRRGQQSPKIENKSSVQVAFGPGALAQDASASSRTYRIPRDEKSRDSRRIELIGSNSDGTQHSISSSSTAEFDRIDDGSMDVSKTSNAKIKEKYREPWDYEHTYYPITLPLRKPGSGNPELLDEAEFGEAARDMECDEETVNAASELGLLDSEEGENMRLLFFQLPDTLPFVKRSSRSKGKEIEGISSSPGLKGSTTSSKDDNALEREMFSGMAGSSWRCCTLEELYNGHVGKMLVYKSGAVKLKLGEILFDVSPGSDCTFAQDVVAINPKDHHFCAIGQLEKRAIVTPDVNFLLDRNFGSSQTMGNAH